MTDLSVKKAAINYLLCFMTCCFLNDTARANTYTIISNTNWSNIEGGITTTSSDILYIKNGANLTVDMNNAVIGKIVVGYVGTDGGDGTLTFNPGSQLTVTGSTHGGICQIGSFSGNRA